MIYLDERTWTKTLEEMQFYSNVPEEGNYYVSIKDKVWLNTSHKFQGFFSETVVKWHHFDSIIKQ